MEQESSKEFITIILSRGNRQEEGWGEETQITAVTADVY